MDAEQIRLARDSLSRCSKQASFLERFYDLLMASSDEIRKKFQQTDFERQKKVLEDSLFLMMAAAGTKGGAARRELEKLAQRHSRGQLDIKPQWYANWLDCLLKAVAEHDPEYVPKLDAAWRASLEEGIELLSSKY